MYGVRAVRWSWLLVSTLVSCSTEESPRVINCRDAVDIYDPYRHEVCINACYDDFHCPRGSICAKADEDEGGYCVIPGPGFQTSQRALLSGFGVPEMDSVLVEDEAYELQWTRPDDATVVNCVLLICPPAFREPLDGDRWAVPSNPRDVVIANYQHCAIASERSTRPEGSFNLRERDNEHPAELPELELPPDSDGDTIVQCPQGAHGCAPVTELLVGCWAYDDWHVIAATKLVSIDSTRIYPYHDVFTPGGACRPDAPEDMFRVCVLDEPEPELEGATTDASETDGTDGTGAQDDGTDVEQDRSTPTSYGLCSCAQPPCARGRAPDACLRPCLSDCDCEVDADAQTCARPTSTRGVCIAGRCTTIVEE